MEVHIKVNIKMICLTVKVNTYGQKMIFTMAIGALEYSIQMILSTMALKKQEMDQNTKENGRMVYHMGRESVFMLIGVNMMEDGRMGSHMGQAKNKIQMELIMMEIGSMGRLKEKDLRN